MTNPFESTIDIQQYLEQGGDINVINPLTRQNWFEFLLLNTQTNPKDLLTVLCHPELRTYHFSSINKNRICNKLILYFSGWNEASLNLQQQKTFIEHFDLLSTDFNYFNLHINSVNLKQDPPKFILSSEKDEKYNLLFIFLFSKLFNFIQYSEQYHPDFLDAFKAVDSEQSNIWHHFIKKAIIKSHHPPAEQQHKVFLAMLIEHFPEGLLHKNKHGQTPLTIVEEESDPKNWNDPHQTHIMKSLKKLELFLNLKNNMSNNETSIINRKI